MCWPGFGMHAHPTPLYKPKQLHAGPGLINWDLLVACLPSEVALSHDQGRLDPGPSPGSQPGVPGTPRRCDALDVNSGGAVFYCLFEDPGRRAGSTSPSRPPRALVAEQDAQAEPSAAALVTSVAESLAEAASAVAEMQDKGQLPRLPAAAGTPPRPPGSPMRRPSRSLSPLLSRRSRSEPALGDAPGRRAERPDRPAPGLPAAYGCLVIKVPPTRLQCQSELFAGEITRHVGVACPEARIVRQYTYEEDESATPEWGAMLAAAERVAAACPELHPELERSRCVLCG